MYNKTKTNTEPPQPMGSTPNNISTTKKPPPRTDSNQTHQGGGSLNAFYWYQNLALDSVVVKHKIV